MNGKSIALIAALIGFFSAEYGQCQTQSRASAREGSRWTLSEWLETRDRNRMMDLWLSMNSPSPFEAMLGVSSFATSTTTNSANATSSQSAQYVEGEVRAYAQFVGLTVEHSNNSQDKLNDLSGIFNLRIFGNSLQNSSLTLHAGQRTRQEDVSGATSLRRNLFYQGSLQIYFSKYFGFDSYYRQFEPSDSGAFQTDVREKRATAGLFIDFKAVRVFGAWFQEINSNPNIDREASTTRVGIQSGLKIFY